MLLVTLSMLMANTMLLKLNNNITQHYPLRMLQINH